ncbi:MAG TPA: peptidoglycan bridge formation glycyltransferase FemA/FemB family protein [Sedimentisphaerales bacterium]|nr:peptidoglycan bridge formation glycyltransferase FemA/FemB family protein [Sedimentisphaerales bacterium]
MNRNSYKVVLDDIGVEEWQRHAACFADYSIYQTWAYQKVRAEMAGQELSRVVVKDESNAVVTMGHVRIKIVKGLGLKIGYVQQGPLVQAMDGRITCSAEALKALCEAYVGAGVCILRVVPNVCDDETGQRVSQMLKSGGFEFASWVPRYRTLILRLDGSEKEVRRCLDRNFRQKLKKAEKNGIEIRESHSAEFCEILRELYRELVNRKGFKAIDPDEFTKPQLQLSPAEKMSFIIAYCDGRPVSVHLASHVGTTGVALLAATNEQGLARGASYLVWWKAIALAKKAGVKRYDLGGIDPENNPGCYQFKSHISRQESVSIGAFEAYSSLPARAVWRASMKMYNLIRR